MYQLEIKAEIEGYSLDLDLRQGYSLVSIVESLQQLTARLQQESADKERAYTDEYIIRKELQSKLQDSQKRIAELEDELRASKIFTKIEE